MNSEVWLTTLPNWQQQLARDVLVTIRTQAPDAVESIKWGNPYFDLHGGFIKLYAAHDWINIYFYKGYLLKSDLFEKSDNERMRTIKLYQDTQLDTTVFKELVGEAAKLNS